MNFIKAIPYILLVILLFLLLDQCSKNRDKTRNIENLVSYQSEVLEYKAKNDSIIEYNSSITTRIEDLETVKVELMDSIKNLNIKKPTSITTIRTITKIKEVPIYYKDSIPCDTFSRNLNLSNSHYNISLKSNNKGVKVDSLNIFNKSLLVVGEKKNGLFKRNESIVAIQNSNPYIKTLGLENYTIKPNVKWYDKLWFKSLIFGVGVVAGASLTK